MIPLIFSFILKSIFPENTPLEERQKILGAYFDPPGGSNITISSRNRIKNRDNPLRALGYIWVRPPKGHCFIVMTDPEKPDKNICKPTRLSFQLKDIDARGRIGWNVVQGPNDDGTTIFWHTPYRLANVVPLGEFTGGMNENVAVLSCEASESPHTRKITLELFDGRKWFVMFPKHDSLIEGEKKNPNLFVRVMTKSKDGKNETQDMSTDDQGKPKITKEDIKRKHKILALKLSGKYKEVKKKPYEFIVPKWKSYEMNSGYFTASGAPVGLNGKCRYRYSGAPRDLDSGVVECYNTDEFDAIYVHMTCSSSFSPRKKPSKK